MRLESITPMLVELIRPRGIVLRNERGVAQLEGIHLPDGLHWGQMPEGPVFIEEHGLRVWRRSARGAEDRFLSRSARESPRGRRLLPRATRARSVLL